MKNKLFKRLPKKYHERVEGFYSEYNLIDDCKYMLLFTEGWGWDSIDSMPCMSVTEAIDFIKNSKRF